jgi:hypothetical protein
MNVLQNYITDTNCRVKRHLISTSTRQHGRPEETKPGSTICKQRAKMGGILLEPKLDSKVLTVAADLKLLLT